MDKQCVLPGRASTAAGCRMPWTQLRRCPPPFCTSAWGPPSDEVVTSCEASNLDARRGGEEHSCASPPPSLSTRVVEYVPNMTWNGQSRRALRGSIVRPRCKKSSPRVIIGPYCYPGVPGPTLHVAWRRKRVGYLVDSQLTVLGWWMRGACAPSCLTLDGAHHICSVKLGGFLR